MRIGIDARLWKQTGVGRYIRNLVHGIDSRETPYTYLIYLMNEEFDRIEFKNPNLQKRRAHIRWHSIQEQLALPMILEKDDLDLMHFTYYSVPFRYKKPYIITMHDLIIYHSFTGKASTLPFPLYYAKHAAYKFLLSQIRKNTKKIIVPLQSTAKDIENVFPGTKDKIVVTPEGFDTAIQPGKNVTEVTKFLQNKKYFLYVGNAYPHKNLQTMIDAFESFQKSQTDDIFLVLVGKSDFFYKRYETENTNQAIQFLHDVSDTELGWLYHNAHALIAPSKIEGFGLPVLEAMAMKTLVLASDIGAFREVCQDAALFFDPNNSDRLSRLMNDSLSMSESQRKQYIHKGIEQTKTFSWEKMVSQTIDVYTSVLEEGRQSL